MKEERQKLLELKKKYRDDLSIVMQNLTEIDAALTEMDRAGISTRVGTYYSNGVDTYYKAVGVYNDAELYAVSILIDTIDEHGYYVEIDNRVLLDPEDITIVEISETEFMEVYNRAMGILQAQLKGCCSDG